MKYFILIPILSWIFLPFSAPAQPAMQDTPNGPIPVLAYYYIWYNQNSWGRAKTDYPSLGQYTSNDAEVIRQHIQWAQAAGIQGFIVSWKNTDFLSENLRVLIKISEELNFKLVIIYQGLDFERKPLPVDIIGEDLDYFINNFAQSPVFNLFEKPVVIWSGSWEFNPTDIAEVTQKRRSDLLILASEKNEKNYLRVADLFDGDAYYWSSVNPETYPSYTQKLNQMGETVHAHHGLWIAPAAVGFDARLVGGTSVVDRKNGETLREEFNAAYQSSPDAIGLISWNEFSENTYIEPSQKYGNLYLKVVADINRVDPPVIESFDSSEPNPNIKVDGTSGRYAALGGLILLVAASTVRLFWHQKER